MRCGKMVFQIPLLYSLKDEAFSGLRSDDIRSQVEERFMLFSCLGSDDVRNQVEERFTLFSGLGSDDPRHPQFLNPLTTHS